MNSATRHTASSYFRADYILVATTVCVCVLVTFLLIALAGENNLHRHTLQTIFEARGVRDSSLSLTQALAGADAARRAALIGDDRDAQLRYGEAKAEARAEAAAMDRIGAGVPEVAAAVANVHRLTEQFLAELDSVTGAQLRANQIDPTAATRGQLTNAVDSLRELVNRRNDAAREAEDRARAYIDAIAALLAIVAFLAPAMAILAVRRERKLWREANQLAEQASAEAAASNMAKSRFLAAASHDMRQPLHALSLYISALERRVVGEEARDILAKMDRATQSLVGMFAKLLDLARIQAAGVRVDISPVRLQDVVERIVAEQPERAVEWTPSDAVISTDPVLFDRLLGNLVANALKHGGGHARIEIAEAGEMVEIAVADDGPGIAQEDQERIFEEFTRLTRHSDGLGLGLSIVRRVANLLDLDLKLRSAPGEGARFSVRVPRAVGAAAPETALANVNAMRGQQVLVIDDDQMAREAAARAFADLGAEVRTGANAADAATITSGGFTPRLVIMDLRIDNEIAGVDIARRLRQVLAPPPAVIIVTGDTGPETLAILKLSGFVWLIKPVDSADLREAALTLISST